MLIIVLDNEKKPMADYIEAIKQEDMDVKVNCYFVSDRNSRVVREELTHLNYPILTEGKRIHCKTFGKFEVFIDGIPVVSKYNKTRELFAYLVDKNGTLSGTEEIMDTLWEDGGANHVSYMKNIRSDMISTLQAHGLGDVIVRQYGRLGIIPDMINCDYYDMLNGDPKAIAKYTGEYMSQYSWAEYTNGILSEIKEEKGY